MDDQATPPVTPSQFHCGHCGYNLTGLTIGGSCPGCGEPIETSIRAVQSNGSCGTATACMIFGILSLAVCGLLGPVAIVLYYRAQNQLATGMYGNSSGSMATAGLVTGIIGTVLACLQIGLLGSVSLPALFG